jgi:peptidoglycan/LPS O-acetylase OafA/YrhL
VSRCGLCLVGFYLTPCRLDALLLGSWVALVWRNPSDWAQLRRQAVPLFMGSGGLLLGIALGQRHFIPGANPSRTHEVAVDGTVVITLGIAALAVFFSALVVLALDAAEGSRLRLLFENVWLRSIGKYSYAIYVFHPLILVASVRLLWPLSRVPAYFAKPVGVVWVLAASFVAAWVSYQCYEKHFLRLRRYFKYREPVCSSLRVRSQFEPSSSA